MGWTYMTKTRLFKYIETVTTKKGELSDKQKWYIIFPIPAKKIDGWYLLEPSHRDDSNEYPRYFFRSRNKKNNVYPCKPQFDYIKVGLKGVRIM